MARPTSPLDDTASATILASRSLLGYVVRSLAPALEELTLVQFRALVVLDGHEGARMSDVAARLGVHPSTLTRTIERLEAGGWVTRTSVEGNRREVRVDLTPRSRDLVAQVTRRRREDIAGTLATMSADDREAVRRGMELFAAAAGEAAPDELLELGL